MRKSPSPLNEPSLSSKEGVIQGVFIVLLCILTLGQSGEPIYHLGLQLAR